jgi:hypothetical protein
LHGSPPHVSVQSSKRRSDYQSAGGGYVNPWRLFGTDPRWALRLSNVAPRTS